MRNWIWLLAPLAALLSVLSIIRYRNQVPERADWAAAVAEIKGQLKPNDGVTWAPYYMGEGRIFLRKLNAFHLADDGPVDFSRYRRVWLMATPHADIARYTDAHQVISTAEFGPLTLYLLDVQGEQVVADLYNELEDVVVTKGGKGVTKKTCDFWSGRGWYCDLKLPRKKVEACLQESTGQRLNRHRRRRAADCGLNRWLNVSRDVRAIGRTPRRCVWFHPESKRVSSIDWKPRESGDQLVVDFGFTDQAIVHNTRPETRTKPMTLLVKSGETVLGRKVVKPEMGWHRWRLPIQGQRQIQFEVTTASQVDAHFCFDPTIRRSGGRP
ncbi:MAG: hypothetical protein ACON3Z_15295 [Bradymonadia bacterium]